MHTFGIGMAKQARIMKHDIRRQSQATVRAILAAGLVLPSLLLPFRAVAALGGDAASINADQQQMKATRRTAQARANYTVQEITTPYGTVVREYIGPDGKVFGVAWRGPFLPNLQEILGPYYQQFAQATQQARTASPRRSRNAPAIVDEPGLVVHSGGHMRAYSGQAYLPGMVPPGVNTNEIR
jgi:hypothetical protein